VKTHRVDVLPLPLVLRKGGARAPADLLLSAFTRLGGGRGERGEGEENRRLPPCSRRRQERKESGAGQIFFLFCRNLFSPRKGYSHHSFRDNFLGGVGKGGPLPLWPPGGKRSSIYLSPPPPTGRKRGEEGVPLGPGEVGGPLCYFAPKGGVRRKANRWWPCLPITAQQAGDVDNLLSRAPGRGRKTAGLTNGKRGQARIAVVWAVGGR